jgi:anion-transporting  ArsA/GET3 family ATPase
LSHPMYTALCDKFATSTDTFAGARIAEWLQSGEFSDIVIDTAPGLHALDFIKKPDKVADFFDGKLVEWLKLFFSPEADKLSFVQKIVKSGAKKLLDGMGKIGGDRMVSSLADFFILLDAVFAKMLERVRVTSDHFRTPQTKFYVVSSVRQDALNVAIHLKRNLTAIKLNRSLFVLNRCLPDFFFNDMKKVKSEFLRDYFSKLNSMQTQVCDELLRQGNDCVTLPWLAQSHNSEIVNSLYVLGEKLIKSSEGLV